jgi:hypothetical protein
MGSQPRVPRLPASWRLTIRLNCGEAEAPVPGQVLLASVGFLAALRRQAALISEAARVTRAGLLTYGWAMVEVDPEDDRIHRFIVRHFYLRKAAHGHVVSRAISHGVFPLRLQEGELPSDMAVSRPESPRRNDDQQAG